MLDTMNTTFLQFNAIHHKKCSLKKLPERRQNLSETTLLKIKAKIFFLYDFSMGILNKGSDEINKSLHRSSSASFFNNFFLDFFLILLRISPQSYKILSGFF